MLQERKSVFVRPLSRWLACATASALFLSASPVRAESGEESDGDIAAVGTAIAEPAAFEPLGSAVTAFDVARLAPTLRYRGAASLFAAAPSQLTAASTALSGGTAMAVGAAAGAPANDTNAATPPPANASPSAATSANDNTASAPARDDGASLRAVGYIAGGVGIAGMILFAVAGLGAKNAYDRLDENCRESVCDEEARDSDIQDGKLLQKAANIGLATGLTGIGLGVTLIVLGGNHAHDAPPAAGPATGAMVTYGANF